MPDEVPHLIRWNALLMQGGRARQEDAIRAILVAETGLHFALADGLGGHAHGDRASRCAVETAVARLSARAGATPPDAGDWRYLFVDVDRAVLTLGRDELKLRPPASTLIAGTLSQDGACSLAAVGDSSAWRVTADRRVQRLFGAYGSGYGVAAAVGLDLEDGDEVEVQTLELQAGERLVLASDGIETLPETDIEALIRLPFDEVAPSVAAAIVRAGDRHQDNVSLLLIERIYCEPN